jgi:protein-tyrosine phosphatase
MWKGNMKKYTFKSNTVVLLDKQEKGECLMVDIHSHILPGIDDGAQTIDEAIKMAQAAVEDGITHLYATPHHRNGKYENEKSEIMHEVNLFNMELIKRGIPLQVLPGQESRLYKEMAEDLDHGILVPLNNTVNYLLIEFPSSNVPANATDILYEINLKNYKPIIVHPERNIEIMENPELLYELIKAGSLTQITANSIIGNFGKKIMNFSHELIKANMVHFIASDAHNTTSRSFHLKEAYETIQKGYGIDIRYYLQENARYVMQGEKILIKQPCQIKRKFLGIF